MIGEGLLYGAEGAVFIFASFLLGEMLLMRFRLSFASPILQGVVKTSFGYAVWSYISVLLGLLSLLDTIIPLILFLAIFLLSSSRIPAHLREFAKIFSRLKKRVVSSHLSLPSFLFVLLALWVFLYALISILPTATGGDGISYHLPFSIEMIRHGIYFPLKENPTYGNLPLSIESLDAFTIVLFQNVTVLKVVQFGAFLLLIGALLDFCARYLRKKIFVYLSAVMLLANMPFVITGLGGGLTDIFTGLFGIISVIFLIEALTEPASLENPRRIMFSAIFFGFALSTKYLALFFIPINGILLLSVLLRDRQASTSSFRTIMLYGAITFAVGGFWYLKNFLLTGNPVTPMFTSPDAQLADAISVFVADRTALNFFRFPFIFFGEGTVLYLPYAFFSALYFTAANLLFLFFAVQKRLRTVDICLFFVAQGYLLVLFFFSHQTRFLIPSLITQGILFAFMADRFTEYAEEKSPYLAQKLNFLIPASIFCTAVVLFSGSMLSFKGNEFSCLTGYMPADECYLHTRMGNGIYAVYFINDRLRNETVIEYWNPFYTYYLKHGNRYTDEYCPDYDTTSDTGINTCLHDKKIRYYLDDTGGHDPSFTARMPATDHMEEKLRVAKYFSRHGNIVYEYHDPIRNSYSRLYKISL